MSSLRNTTALLTLLGVAFVALVSADATSASPTVHLKSAFVPVPGFAYTGNILGAPAAVQTEYTIEGREYQGTPPPILGIHLYPPVGTGVGSIAAPTCAGSTLATLGPTGCPHGSAIGPTGTARSYVTVGGERVEATAEVSSFYAPGGGLELVFHGEQPVPLEILASGEFFAERLGAVAPELITEMPLTAPTPGVPFATFRSISVTLGFSASSPGEAIYQVPTSCPAEGFLSKAEVIFAENGEQLKPETVTATYLAPCPTESLESHLPETPVVGTGGIVTAPSNKACVSRRDFPIHVQQIKGLDYRRVAVYVNGRRVAVVEHRRFTATVDLRGLPKGRYTVKITVTTTNGSRLTGIRAYHTCAPKPLPGGKPAL